MLINSDVFKGSNKVIAVALSGGSDSMALLHYIHSNQELFGIKVIALNVEHGIRGKDSVCDSNFVKNYCAEHNIPLLSYSVDSLSFAKKNKLSIEQSARILRYQCFYDALNNNKCDFVATAHHSMDNLESVLFNLFRGTGVKGLLGINDYEGKIIRPLSHTSKTEIDEYIKLHNIPFVIDKTNFDDSFSRNALRHKVIPEILKLFPETEKSVLRLSETLKSDEDYLIKKAKEIIEVKDNFAKIYIPNHPALISRASIMALNFLGIKKDWEKAHIDRIISLTQKKVGTIEDITQGIIAIKEYDCITITKKTELEEKEMTIAFSLGKHTIDNENIKIKKCQGFPKNLKDGYYIDADNIPTGAVIRFKKKGDYFTPFNGKQKLLSDYFTDKKIPLLLRNNLPLLAYGNNILAIFGLAISDSVKVKPLTKNILHLTKE